MFMNGFHDLFALGLIESLRVHSRSVHSCVQERYTTNGGLRTRTNLCLVSKGTPVKASEAKRMKIMCVARGAEIPDQGKMKEAET